MAADNFYWDIEKPEEKIKPEVDKDIINSITNAFKDWSIILKENHPGRVHLPYSFLDAMIDSAINLLKPHEKKLPVVIADEQYFLPAKFLLEKQHYECAGIFYTALLHVKEMKLVIPEWFPLSYVGYKMEQGLLEVNGCRGSVSEWSRGGCVINRGTLQNMGNYGTGGLFINYGKLEKNIIVDYYAIGPDRGILVDFVNHPYVNFSSHGATIIVPHHNRIINSGFHDQLYHLPDLEKLVAQLRFATEKETDINQVKGLQKDIESCCKEHYKRHVRVRYEDI